MTVDVPIPANFDFNDSFERVLTKVLAPAAEVEKLKRKPFLSAAEVETLYGLSRDSLKTWRNQRKGPKFEQNGKTSPVRYTHEAIRAFLTGSYTA